MVFHTLYWQLRSIPNIGKTTIISKFLVPCSIFIILYPGLKPGASNM